jgi:acyl carrier protein
MVDDTQVRQAARAVVGEMIGRSVDDSDSLISSGLIDSLSILKLIGKLENRLSVRMPTAQLQPDDFESIDVIVETVERVAEAK